MIYVHSFERTSDDGYLMPVNNPNDSTPDNILYAQLRYNTFTSSYVIQGSNVIGANSTFEFTIDDNLAYTLFKMYVSENGITYTESKSFGGTLGRTIQVSASSGTVTIAGAQTITGDKTFTGTSVIRNTTIPTGYKLSLTDAPTTSLHAANKSYVDNRTWVREYLCRLSQSATSNPVATVIKNTTGGTAVFTRQDAGQYIFTSSLNLFELESGFTIIVDNVSMLSGLIGYIEIDFLQISTPFNTVAIYTYDVATGASQDGILGNTNFRILLNN